MIKKILTQLPAIAFLSFFIVATVAYAQFVQPVSSPTAGNVMPPLTIGKNSSDLQFKNGGLWMNSLISRDGFSFMGPTHYDSMWSTVSGLNTIGVEQLCMGDTCTSAIAPSNAATDVYVTATTCNGGACNGDPYTGAKICGMNGYTHLVSEDLGANGNNSPICNWNGSTWSCAGGCSSSCGYSEISLVSCDNNGTSPLSVPSITANNGSTNILNANTPATGGNGGNGGDGGGGCGKSGAKCVNL